MASILNDYISRNWSIIDFQSELQRLIQAYNLHTGRYMFVYASDVNKAKNGVDVSLMQDDFYTIQDLLRESPHTAIDFYIETPGGSGEAAEEIAKFLRRKFAVVNFVIAGEAKSAGTILVLSGDNIYMTETGSLGPIDAQVRIGRFTVSAHDYQEWVNEKMDEAKRTGILNQFDAIVVAQISPGELKGVINSLEFAKDLVREWLEKYKFKDWAITRGSKTVVTPEMRKERAKEVSDMLCNHTTWRSHARSLKIDDLQDVLLIESLDTDKELADIVYRIKTVIRLIFEMSTTFKLYFAADSRILKNYAVANNPSGFPTSPNTPGLPQQPAPVQPNKGDKLELVVPCPRCQKEHLVAGYVDISSEEILKRNLLVNRLIGNALILTCDNCKLAIDLKPIKAQVEQQIGLKIAFI